MGVLRGKLKQCDWLNDQDKISLSAELDCIENQLKGAEFYPSLENALDAFTELKHFPRIVIVGTDPYPNYKATGIPFSVPDNYTGQCPNSLKTLKRVFGFKCGTRNEWIKWVNDNQVLLLNRALSGFVEGQVTQFHLPGCNNAEGSFRSGRERPDSVLTRFISFPGCCIHSGCLNCVKSSRR